MSVTAHPPGFHINVKTAAATLAAAAIAVGAGFAGAALLLDETVVSTGTTTTDTNSGNPGLGFSDPNGYAGTDRELRELMHRNK